MQERVIAVQMNFQPRKDSIAIIDRPVQFMRLSVRVPGFEGFAVHVQHIARELQVTMPVTPQSISQTCRELSVPAEIFITIYGERMVDLSRRLVLIITEFAIPVSPKPRSENIVQRIKSCVGCDR